ncbi:MAG: AAA family ATPase [Clostridia bacterium]|nr:MAG: AAA family ATPase [Clostridia bacterium]
MLKEMGIGAGIAVVIFLLVQGYNLWPVVAVAFLALLLYYLMEYRGDLAASPLGTVPARQKTTFADIGGQPTAIQELQEALDFILEAENLRQMGIRPLRGILLAGPPGTGKTMLARAAAAYTDAVFLAVSGSEFIEMYAGVGAQRIRNLFRRAQKLAAQNRHRRAVIFIDEIECLGGRRGNYTAHQEYDQTLNQLLVEMDGLKKEQETSILLIGATNRYDMLDEALLRPGRFDRQVRVELPDREGRLQILRLHVANKPLADDVDLEAVAANTFGFSGAHLESLANEAAILALREKSPVITQKHLQDATDKVMLGEKLGRKPGREELHRIAVHETGHALASELLRPGSVSHLTITSRGQALGYMRQAPREDLYLYTQGYMEDQIKICLGGYVSEKMILEAASTGAGSDFQQALEIARQMVESGLSSLGVVSWTDLTAATRQRVIGQIMSAQEESLTKIFSPYRDLIREVAGVLLEQESLGGDRLRQILGGYQKKAELAHAG